MSLTTTRLHGSITPIITPIRNGEVDLPSYQKLVDRHIQAGGHGVLVNGTTAEPSTLTITERNRLVDAALEVARGRCTVVAATGSQSHADTITLTDYATRAGVDALLIVTPYYIRPSQRGLVEYYRDLCARTSLSVMVYHIPGRAAVSITLETLERIMERSANLVGIKHAVNDLGFVTECLTRFGSEFRIFVGLEDLSFPMLALGACGLMNAIGNIAPEKVAQLYRCVVAGDLMGARGLHYELFALNRAAFSDTNPIPIKYMARRLGLIPCNEHRLPMVAASRELEERLDRLLLELELVKP